MVYIIRFDTPHGTQYLSNGRPMKTRKSATRFATHEFAQARLDSLKDVEGISWWLDNARIQEVK